MPYAKGQYDGKDHPNKGKRYVNKRPLNDQLYRITAEQIAWVAGIIEGEGSFIVEKRRIGKYATRLYVSGRITVNMTDQDVIERLAELCGGNVTYEPQKAPNRKDQWRWTFRQYENLKVLCDLLRPWMAVRRTAQMDHMFEVVDEAREEVRRLNCPD